jgi:DUF917 family protein
MKTLSYQEAINLILGAEILGCGGGGSIEMGEEMIKEIYGRGKKFTIMDPKEIGDDDLVVIVSTIGGGVPKEIQEKVEKLPKISEKPELVAVRELAKYIRKEPFAFLPSEIGAGNTVLPMYVAAIFNKFAIDADACGRAKPELSISTTHVKGIPVTPLVVVSPFGDIVILKEALNDYRAEDICRYITAISGGSCGMARCPTKGKVIRNAVVPNSITKCIQVGEAIRKAKEAGLDPVDEFIKATTGIKIFEGKVKVWEREKKEAFMWGKIIIDGFGDYVGHTLKVWFKNEFLISWMDEKPYVTCPDSICIIDAETGRGLSNWIADLSAYVGKKVVVVGIKAADLWRTKKGIQLFGPKHFGYPIEYVPIEKLVVDE